MHKMMKHPFSYLSMFAACSIMALTTGCASGGFKLTREYAGWVNSQNIILRIVLYLFTGIVYAITLLIDLVIFNTVDFWEGHISAGTYNFNKDDKTYQVKHEYLPETKLKQSTIHILDLKHKLLQEVVLRETQSHEIEMFVDGKLRARVHGISELPVASVFDSKGKLIEEKVVPVNTTYAMNL